MQLFLIFSAFTIVFYFIQKKKLALENDNKKLKKDIELTKKDFESVNRINLKEKSLNRELMEEIQRKNCQILTLEKEEILKKQLEKQIENLQADKKKLFDLVEKTIDRKPSITHENVHQKITWSQNTMNSSSVDSGVSWEAHGFPNSRNDIEQEITLELRAKNQDLTTKLESVRAILRQHLLVDLNEGRHRLDHKFFIPVAGSAAPGRFPTDNPCPRTRPLVRTKSQNRL